MLTAEPRGLAAPASVVPAEAKVRSRGDAPASPRLRRRGCRRAGCNVRRAASSDDGRPSADRSDDGFRASSSGRVGTAGGDGLRPLVARRSGALRLLGVRATRGAVARAATDAERHECHPAKSEAPRRERRAPRRRVTAHRRGLRGTRGRHDPNCAFVAHAVRARDGAERGDRARAVRTRCRRHLRGRRPERHPARPREGPRAEAGGAGRHRQRDALGAWPRVVAADRLARDRRGSGQCRSSSLVPSPACTRVRAVSPS